MPLFRSAYKLEHAKNHRTYENSPFSSCAWQSLYHEPMNEINTTYDKIVSNSLQHSLLHVVIVIPYEEYYIHKEKADKVILVK